MQMDLPPHLAGLDGMPESHRLVILAAALAESALDGEPIPAHDVALYAREISRIAGAIVRMETTLDEIVSSALVADVASRTGRVTRIRRHG